MRHSADVSDKLKSGTFKVDTTSSYDFSNMNAMPPHDKIKDRLSTSLTNGLFSVIDCNSYKSWAYVDLIKTLSFLSGQNLCYIW